MIVNQAPGGWNIIFQRAHALLAGKIATQWKVSERPQPWTDVLATIIDHDDGQSDWRGRQHLTEAGAPLDFTYQEPDLAQAQRTVANARYRSRWVALLTSMHTSALYERLRGTDKDIDDFLDEQRGYQQQLRRDVGLRKPEAETMYRLVFFCDACSLLLCKDEVPKNGNRIELADTPDRQAAFIFYQDDVHLTIDPWPFEEDTFTVDVDVFQLTQLSFTSDEEFYQTLDQTEVASKQWTFRK